MFRPNTSGVALGPTIRNKSNRPGVAFGKNHSRHTGLLFAASHPTHRLLQPTRPPSVGCRPLMHGAALGRTCDKILVDKKQYIYVSVHSIAFLYSSCLWLARELLPMSGARLQPDVNASLTAFCASCCCSGQTWNASRTAHCTAQSCFPTSRILHE